MVGPPRGIAAGTLVTLSAPVRREAEASVPIGDVIAAPLRIEGGASATATARRSTTPPPPAGNPSGVPLPAEALPVDTSRPDRTIGNGTASSCTSRAVVEAVAAGGIITFDCGSQPVTIVMDDTAKVVNTSSIVVLDGRGKVTLSGADRRRILYMNTCDQAQIWTTSHRQNQDQPQLTIEGLRFTHGNSTGDTTEGGGGGAVFFVLNDRTGELAITSSTLARNPSRGFETAGYPGIFFLGLGARRS